MYEYVYIMITVVSQALGNLFDGGKRCDYHFEAQKGMGNRKKQR